MEKVDYSKKIITIDKALSLVKNNDKIVTGLGAAEAREFFTHIHEIFDKGIRNITINNCLPMCIGEYLTNPSYAKFFEINGWFYTPVIRKLHPLGAASFIPNHLHFAGLKRFQHIKPNIYVGNASMPDRHGYVSLALSNTYEKQAIAKADLTILEINPNVPRTFGDVQLHVSEVDYLVETNYAVPEIPDAEPSELDKKIGQYIADEIQDGDCIQLGIGSMPNAIAKSLYNKKNLGVHTEMLTSEIPKLVQAGVINGSKKQLLPEKMVCTFILGTREMYDFVDDNPGVAVMDGGYVNDPYVIAQNDNQVSVNSCIEIDITGQCASESVGVKQISGTGGQADTVIGAQNSKGGRSYICLYSTATTKGPDGGTKLVSKIVPTLNVGAAVSLSRNDVDRVVTEYGIAELRGTTVRERVERLVAIAHPDFREQLLRDTYALGIIGRRAW
jgi:acyl-CoA hydrolase